MQSCYLQIETSKIMNLGNMKWLKAKFMHTSVELFRSRQSARSIEINACTYQSFLMIFQFFPRVIRFDLRLERRPLNMQQ